MIRATARLEEFEGEQAAERARRASFLEALASCVASGWSCMRCGAVVRKGALAAATALFAAAAPTEPLDAQELVGWRLLYSSDDYDYRLDEASLAALDDRRESRSGARVTVAQMLVRHLERARVEVVDRVERRGLSSAGYERYASSTHVIELECASNEVRVLQTTDFALDGTALHMSQRVNPWATAAGLVDPRANAALLRRVCDEG